MSTSEDEQERELEALLELSRRGRAKLDRLHEVLTSPGHYGTGATPSAVVYRENKLRLLRLLDEQGKPRTGPPVLFALHQIQGQLTDLRLALDDVRSSGKGSPSVSPATRRKAKATKRTKRTKRPAPTVARKARPGKPRSRG